MTSDKSFDAPTEQVIRAFNSLHGDPNFMTIMDWLQDVMIVKALSATAIENEKARNWEDGKVQAISKILEFHNNSRQMLEKVGEAWRVGEGRKAGAF